jgi:Spy/CpxP family protein refolding chaperone
MQLSTINRRRQALMKTIRKIALLAVCALATAAFAQQNPPPQGGPGDGQGRHRPTVEEQVKGLTDRYNLTADQQAKAKTILEDAHSQMMKVMQDESMTREDKMAKGRTLHEAAAAKIREILTDDQKKKFDDTQKEMQDRMRPNQAGGDGPPKDGPPPK